MKRPGPGSKRQLPLSLQREVVEPLSAEKHEEIVSILADLLLEALGKEVALPASNAGDRDESEDHR